MKTGGNRIGSRRRALQVWLTALGAAAVLAGFLGHPLFGLDIDAGSFLFFGLPVKPTGLFPVLLLVLALLSLFLWAASALGRFWCGWLCPQSILSDITHAAGKKFKSAKKFAVHVAGLAAALGYSAIVLFFFVTPQSLAFGAPPGRIYTAYLIWLILAFLLYLDSVFVGRTFCRVLCPYGKLLTALTGRDPVLPQRLPERIGDCIECAHCNKVCPMDLDPRTGKHADCIACGRCVDVCDRIMDKRGTSPGLVRYVLPEDGILKGLFLKPGRIILLAAGVGLFSVSFYMLTAPETARLLVRLTPGAKTRVTAEGKTAVFLTVSARAPKGSYTLMATGPDGGALELRSGLSAITVGPSGKADAGVVLVIPGEISPGHRVTLSLIDQSGIAADHASIEIGGER